MYRDEKKNSTEYRLCKASPIYLCEGECKMGTNFDTCVLSDIHIIFNIILITNFSIIKLFNKINVIFDIVYLFQVVNK